MQKTSIDQIRSMLHTFQGVWSRKTPLSEDVIKAYYQILKKYNFEDVRKAGYSAMDECEFFPKPFDLVNRIKNIQIEEHLEGQLIRTKTCHICGEEKQCIIDEEVNAWVCRQCYTGMTPGECKAKIEEIVSQIKNLPEVKIEQSEDELPAKFHDDILNRKQELLKQYQQLKEQGW